MSPYCIWYIMISRAISRLCSRVIHSSSFITAVGLLYQLKSCKIYLAAFRWTISNLSMFALVYGLHTVEAYFRFRFYHLLIVVHHVLFTDVNGYPGSRDPNLQPEPG